MKPLMSEQYAYIKETFPNAAILSTIGNNDLIQYYEVPRNQTVKDIFYGDLYSMWFGSADAPTANQNYAKFGKIVLCLILIYLSWKMWVKLFIKGDSIGMT